jgi:hypothetical protein
MGTGLGVFNIAKYNCGRPYVLQEHFVSMGDSAPKVLDIETVLSRDTRVQNVVKLSK